MELQHLKHIIEGVLLAAGEPVTLEQLAIIFAEDNVSKELLQTALTHLEQDFQERAVELKYAASGYRLQVRASVAPWLAKLWQEKPQRYSRALLETLALVAYQQPITRAEVEAVRGVAVSSAIIKTLLDRTWIKIVGHREVPGKPALYATTKQFLDDFNLKNLAELPTLEQIKMLETPEEFPTAIQLPLVELSPLPEVELA